MSKLSVILLMVLFALAATNKFDLNWPGSAKSTEDVVKYSKTDNGSVGKSLVQLIDSTEWTVLRNAGYDPVMVKTGKERSILIEGTPPTVFIEKLRKEKLANTFARFLKNYGRHFFPRLNVGVKSALNETPCGRQGGLLDTEGQPSGSKLLIAPGGPSGYFTFKGEKSANDMEVGSTGNETDLDTKTGDYLTVNSSSNSHSPSLTSFPPSVTSWDAINITNIPNVAANHSEKDNIAQEVGLPVSSEELPTDGTFESTFANGTSIPLPDGRRLPPVTSVPATEVSLLEPEELQPSTLSKPSFISAYLREYLKKSAAGKVDAGDANNETSSAASSSFN